ncbi:MAG: class III poly(R)-hydroxyalkanoic acid synthase subunit PhaC, partial [Myxococcota bacterium]
RGEMVVGERTVDLRQIVCPVMTITARKDTIVPPESAEVLPDVVGSSDVKVLRFECGHIGLATSSKGPRLYWPEVSNWIAERSVPSG